MQLSPISVSMFILRSHQLSQMKAYQYLSILCHQSIQVAAGPLPLQEVLGLAKNAWLLLHAFDGDALHHDWCDGVVVSGTHLGNLHHGVEAGLDVDRAS